MLGIVSLFVHVNVGFGFMWIECDCKLCLVALWRDQYLPEKADMLRVAMRPPFFCVFYSLPFSGACCFVMDNSRLKHLVLDLVMPLVEAQHLELWGLEIVSGPVLRVCVYVDQPLGELSDGSATIDQCEAISRQLGLALDVEDCIDHAWELEVSSPGLERKFFRLEQMSPYVGDVVEVRLSAPLAGSERKKWLGRLLHVNETGFGLQPCAVTGDGEILLENGSAVDILWRNAAYVRRRHIFSVPQKPGRKKRKA